MTPKTIELEKFIFDNIDNQEAAAHAVVDIIGVLIGLKPATINIFDKKKIEKWDLNQFFKILQSLDLEVVSCDMSMTKEFNLTRDDESFGKIEKEFFISRDQKTAEQLHDAFVRMRRAMRDHQQKEWEDATREIGKLLGYPETAIEAFVAGEEDKGRAERMARNRYYVHSEKYEEQEFEAYEKKLHQALIELAPKTAEILKAETGKRWL